MQTLTADSIERWVERRMDRLDHAFMNTKMSQEEYDEKVKAIHRAAEAMYDRMPKENRNGQV